MARKLHPADAANAKIIANAIRFDIALFLGTGRYATDTAASLSEARIKAVILAAQHHNGRKPLIYAIDANGRSGLVIDEARSKPKEDAMKTYAKKFNAQRAAKVAGHSPDEVEIVKTKDGFAYRVKTAKVKDTPRALRNADNTSAAAMRSLGKRAAIEAAARDGDLPPEPDFSAETHKRFRAKLAKLIELAKAGDVDGLKAIEINPVSTSPRAMQRYRDLCIVAIEARKDAA